LNRVEFITEAIESVLHQDYKHIEHIIMDGGSTDGTLELLNKFPHLRVISQPDRGIYDALNKGIQIASGEVIGFLNTDDFYEPDVFASIVQVFCNNTGIDALVGAATMFQVLNKDKRERMMFYPPVTPQELLLRSTQGDPNFNAWFFHKSLFNRIGCFDIGYRYSADREFLIRFSFQTHNYVCIDQILYHYRMHPGSFTFNNRDNGEADFMFENRDLAERYLKNRDINTQAQQIFKDWHSQITSDETLTALHNMAFGRAGRYIIRGESYNFLWPIIFIKRAFPRASRFLHKKIHMAFNRVLENL